MLTLSCAGPKAESRKNWSKVSEMNLEKGGRSQFHRSLQVMERSWESMLSAESINGEF